MTYHVVAIYDEHRAYGGPEEGGWWYTCGELVDVVSGSHDLDEAYRLRGVAHVERGQQAHVVTLGERRIRPDLEEYLCHGDADEFYGEDGELLEEFAVYIWEVPTHFPRYRPHYC